MADSLDREQMIELVRRISSGQGTEDQVTEWLQILKANVPDPGVSDLIFWPDRELTPEEVVDRALAYEVVAFPPPGESHLVWAVRTGNLQVAEALLTQGADPAVLSSDGKTLRQLAEEMAHPGLVVLLSRYQTG